MPRTLADFVDLTAPQRSVLLRLEREERFTKHFYFTGGTLLKALGIVPRESNDLDFFTFPEVEGHAYAMALTQVRAMLIELFGEENIRSTDRGFLLVREGMRVECIYDSVKNIDEFVPYGNLKTPGLRDFAANKAAAFCVREEVKDTIDIALLTKRQGWFLRDLADIAEEKFRMGTFSEKKLFTELLHKRDTLRVTPEMFLRDGEANVAMVREQVASLLDCVSL